MIRTVSKPSLARVCLVLFGLLACHLNAAAQLTGAWVELPQAYTRTQEAEVRQCIIDAQATSEPDLVRCLHSVLGSDLPGRLRITLFSQKGMTTFTGTSHGALAPGKGMQYTVVRGGLSKFKTDEDLLTFWSDTIAVIDTMHMDVSSVPAFKRTAPKLLVDTAVAAMGALYSFSSRNGLRLLSIHAPFTDDLSYRTIRLESERESWFRAEAVFVLLGNGDRERLAELVADHAGKGSTRAEIIRHLEAYARAWYGRVPREEIERFVDRQMKKD